MSDLGLHIQLDVPKRLTLWLKIDFGSVYVKQCSFDWIFYSPGPYMVVLGTWAAEAGGFLSDGGQPGYRVSFRTARAL